MLFEKKIKRVIDVEKAEDSFKNTEPEPLEKGDKLAMFLAALITLLPVLLIFAGLIFVIFWLII